MKPIEFSESNTTYAKNQPPYLPLPGYRFPDALDGRIAFCWKLSPWERIKILFTGKVWQQVLTFNKPLQPQKLGVNKPF